MLRKIFERRVVSALLILFEIILLVLFSIFLSNYFLYFWIVTIILDLIFVLRILNIRTISEYKAPWICVVLLIPFIGVLLYLLFYKRHLGRKEVKHLDRMKKTANQISFDGVANDSLKQADYDGFLQAQLIRKQADASVYRNTSAKYYSIGEDMFDDMLKDLSKAKKFIFLEYFILSKGYMWDSILRILKLKVKEGVEVRVMYDDVGSLKTIPSHYDRKLRKIGIDCRIFSKITPKASSRHNNRNHRKILVIDGIIAYTGGINIADEYINKKVRFGHWKDGGIRLFGDAVNGLTKLYLMDWDLNSHSISDYVKYHVRENLSIENNGGYYIPYGDGPSPIYDNFVAKNVYLNMINAAKSYIYISTPYLIVDSELIDSLCNAAIKGVDVRIFTPHIPDKKVIHIMTRSSYKQLIESGVKVFEYRDGFIHAKNVLCDDKFAVVGTINFDYRSLVHHYENAVWIYNSEIIPDMKKDFETLSLISINVDKPIKFKLHQKLIKSIAEFFAPLL